jgi:hypothetical protein
MFCDSGTTEEVVIVEGEDAICWFFFGVWCAVCFWLLSPAAGIKDEVIRKGEVLFYQKV